MQKTKLKWLAVLAPVVLGGCFESNADRLVGYWECDVALEAGSAKYLVEYVDGGEFSGEATITASESGMAFSFEVLLAGTWRVNDDSLTERITNMTVTSFVVDGVNLPTDSIPRDELETLMASSSTSTIVTLDDENLVSRRPDESTVCRRR